MIFDGDDIFTFSAQTGATLVANANRKTAPLHPPVNANTGVTATQTVVSDALTIGGGGIGYINPMALVVKYSAAQNASGSNTVQFVLQESADNSTWTDRVVSDVVNLSTTPAANTVTLPFTSQTKYIRLRIIIAGAGSTPTVTVTFAAITPTQI